MASHPAPRKQPGRAKTLSTCCMVAILTANASLAEAACFVVRAATDLNGIRLHDPASAKRVLGPIVDRSREQIEQAAKANSMTIVSIFNRDKSEMAVVSAYPGVEAGDFAFIKVGDPKQKPVEKAVVLAADHLMTARGIRIGVPESFVTNLLGQCYTREVERDGTIILDYRIGYEAHPLLKRSRAHSYSARYRFGHGHLVSFILWL